MVANTDIKISQEKILKNKSIRITPDLVLDFFSISESLAEEEKRVFMNKIKELSLNVGKDMLL